MADHRDKVLMLDFDGTICRGDAPVLAFAERVSGELEPAAGKHLRATVEAFLSGDRPTDMPPALDGYDAVTQLALRAGIGRDHIQDAFLTTRKALSAGDLPIEVPADLELVLRDISVNVRIVLVSNAPAVGLDVLLDRVGVTDLLDEIIGDAHKPTGMDEITQRLLSDIDAAQRPWRALSVGDIWENDLRVPSERGCGTAYIDRFGLRDGEPSVTAPTIEELYESIRGWAGEMSDDALRSLVYPHSPGR